MKYIKLLGLTALVTGIMAIAGTGLASATELTCGSGVMCPAETTVKAESEGKVVLDAPFGNIECNSTLEGPTNGTGGASITIEITITIHFTNCGNDTVVQLVHLTWILHVRIIPPRITNTWTGWRFTVVHVGFHCIFEASNTDVGSTTGSSETGGNATLDISGTIPRVGGSSGAFCGSSAPFTGSYKVTSPSVLDAD